MATLSSVFVWEISRTELPGRLQSIGSQSRTLTLSYKHYHIHKNKCTTRHKLCIFYLFNSVVTEWPLQIHNVKISLE